MSLIEGKAYDASGVVKYTIRGSWLDEIYIKNLDQGSEE